MSAVRRAPFVHDGFLLETSLAAELYEGIRTLPLIDYHGHLSPEQLARDHRFGTSPKRGWRATTTNGGRCVRTGSPRA